MHTRGYKRVPCRPWIKSDPFSGLLGQHKDISKHLKPKDIRHLGSIDYQLRNVAKIYQETLG